MVEINPALTSSEATKILSHNTAIYNKLTKVRLVKAIVFPVVMYGCDSWTVKKAERRRMMLLTCGVGEDS